ncbi:F-box/FBD/LRR-repeat protein-like protein [Tanacetum coccineum]
MKVHHQSSDIISTMHEDIIDSILTRLPIRDALRTSILSRRWRYCWMSMPKVKFDAETFFKDKQMEKYKLVNAVFHVLLLHKGPILELDLRVGELDMVSEFHQIILHLSRSNHVQMLTFEILTDHYWKLPSVFFTLQGLECLAILNCVFEPPLMFNGFNRLSQVLFSHVEISPKSLLHFLSSCPLLEVVTLGVSEAVGLGASETDFKGGNEFTLVDLFECLPLLECIEMTEDYMKYFCAGGPPQKLPTSLVRLKYLFLDGYCFTEKCAFSSALCIIRSSPNLELIHFSTYDNEKLHDQQTSMKLLHLQNDSSLSLDHLEELIIIGFCYSPYEIEFVKLILAKSHGLKKLKIEISCNVSVRSEDTVHRDLIQALLLCASTSAKFIVTRK